MPWKETDIMKERIKFVLEWERQWSQQEGNVNLAALCRVFEISRETGYYWLRRYRDADHSVEAVEGRSKRPLTSPTKVSPEIEDLVIRARKKFPNWGPRKLHRWLSERKPELSLPAVSTIGNVLKRHGLSRRRKRRDRSAPPRTQPFASCDRPNALWCVDFKGHFRTTDGDRIYPLTITDACTRFLIRCEGMRQPRGPEVQAVFESAFEEYGVPEVIRSDNGPPFASTGAGGLTDLSVWWIKHGIRLERIDPGKPQQNGRHERMHLTLKQETAMPPRSSFITQQRAFDHFRQIFNHERPHEALGMETPASLYEASERKLVYVSRLKPSHDAEARLVDGVGRIKWGRNKVFISRALRSEYVELHPAGLRLWELRYGSVVLGMLDDSRLSRGLIRPKKQKRRRPSGSKPI